MALNDTLDQMDLTVIFKVFTPQKQNIHCFQVHLEHFLGQIEIISSIFSDHNDMKTEVNYKKETEKHTNMEANNI